MKNNNESKKVVNDKILDAQEERPTPRPDEKVPPEPPVTPPPVKNS